jgi:hypothetical protein
MAVWITEQHTYHCIRPPSIFDHIRPDCQRNHTRQDPDVLDHRHKSPFLEVVAEACEED